MPEETPAVHVASRPSDREHPDDQLQSAASRRMPSSQPRRVIPPISLGVVVMALSFTGVYRYRVHDATVAALCKHLSALPQSTRGEYSVACGGITNDAWRGIFGWVGAVLAAGAAVVLVIGAIRRTPLTSEATRSLPLPLYCLATLSLLAGALVVPSGKYNGRTIDAFSSSVSASHTSPYWAMLIACAAATVAAARHRTTPVRHESFVAEPNGFKRRDPFE